MADALKQNVHAPLGPRAGRGTHLGMVRRRYGPVGLFTSAAGIAVGALSIGMHWYARDRGAAALTFTQLHDRIKDGSFTDRHIAWDIRAYYHWGAFTLFGIAAFCALLANADFERPFWLRCGATVFGLGGAVYTFVVVTRTVHLAGHDYGKVWKLGGAGWWVAIGAFLLLMFSALLSDAARWAKARSRAARTPQA
jgi:hypothetical protein